MSSPSETTLPSFPLQAHNVTPPQAFLAPFGLPMQVRAAKQKTHTNT